MAGEAIFISYRRDDSKSEADAIYKALAERIGESHLYKDVDNIPLGADFGAHIRSILPRCQIALIVIGPKWAKVTDRRGRRRLADPHDWVRIEVELALAGRDLRVVPVLVNGAVMPRANEVPPSLHPLLGRNAAILRRSPGLNADIDRLLSALALVAAPEMVRIPSGEFTMGSSKSEPGHRAYESPQHRVVINAFELGKYPVTFAEWDAAMAAGANLYKLDDNGFGRDRRPAIIVSWHDAQAYIAWLNSKTSGGYRLPTEAEWEYACRAGTTTPYSTGDVITTSQAQFGRGSLTTPVGSYAPNAFGLHDMHGNAWEWCEDIWHENYDGAPDDGSAWVSGGDATTRVLRGGSGPNDVDALRSAYRNAHFPNDRHIISGFRLARAV
jgi:formylglycine-generating enzyme required for sulfatase activity